MRFCLELQQGIMASMIDAAHDNEAHLFETITLVNLRVL